MRNAKSSINLEAYIFHHGEVANRFRDALVERAKAGVEVRVVVDALSSFSTPKRYFKPVMETGGRMEWYHPLRWNNWTRVNNRTHREMLIVDGEIGFIGGAGIDDQWLVPKRTQPRWRDTMCRVRGEAVEGLQSVFLENWLNSSGEILAGAKYFPALPQTGNAQALVIDSTPSFGGSTRAHVLYQALIRSAKKSIYITTPYFLPDGSIREEVLRALKDRNVEIKIIRKSAHAMTRNSSRALYGGLLKAGAETCEYSPTMIHAKIMIVDGIWSVVGSTSFDNRSFGINDEVNLAAREPRAGDSSDSGFSKRLGTEPQNHLRRVETPPCVGALLRDSWLVFSAATVDAQHDPAGDLQRPSMSWLGPARLARADRACAGGPGCRLHRATREVVDSTPVGRANQAQAIADAPGGKYRVAFGRTRDLRGSNYGNATLSRLPIECSENYNITWQRREPRGCLRTDLGIKKKDRLPHVFNVHLGTSYRERRAQGPLLLSDEMLNHAAHTGPRVILGDFNEWPRGLTSELTARQFQKIRLRDHQRKRGSFPGPLPVLELDHIYYDGLELTHFGHPHAPALIASDHLPLVADFRVSYGGRPPQSSGRFK